MAPLGRGGRGEVWRADDLKLGQPVALKFLPPELAADPRRRERLIAEARLARQIAHPNVCRVYDLGEADGQHFLSMEYVDGEDLASLLRRIGRLPREKALDVARQLCAGLAAAAAPSPAAFAWNVPQQRTIVLNTFYGCIVLLLLRLGLRRTVPAVAVTIGLYTLAFAGGGPVGLVLAVALQVTVMAVVLFRWGLLALVVASWGFRVLRSAPLTLDLDLWFADRSLLALGLVLGLAVWAWNQAREPVPLLGVRPAEA